MAAVAARQHGVVSHRQLIECGVSASTITRWVNSGRLHRVHRGVYAVGHRNLTREGTWMAAVLACGAGAALSCEPAGQLLYLVDRNERFRVHVSVPPGRTPAPPGVIVHRTPALDARDMTTRRHIPVTTPTRTAWDLAAGHSPRLARRAYVRAEGTGTLDRRRMVELVSSAPSRKGTRLIRELLGSRPLPLSEVRSWLEDLLLHLCAEHRLPLPLVNVPVLGYEVDFFWPQARFIVEADGSHHLDPSQRDGDNDRDFELAVAGHLVRRYSYRAMGREARVEGEIRAALASRLPRTSEI